MEHALVYDIDLTAIEGEGDFLCPVCEAFISPDDETGMTYDIVEIETIQDCSLAEVIISCKMCETKIRLKGFEMLDETEEDLEELFALGDYLQR